MNRILVVGVFDLFHRGHLELLRQASIYGDIYAIVNGDVFTEKYKRLPIINEVDRLEIVKSIKWVSHAEISNEPDVKPYIEKYKINKILHGDDWDNKSYLQQICIDDVYLWRNNIEMIYTPYYKGISTSGLISSIRKKNET